MENGTNDIIRHNALHAKLKQLYNEYVAVERELAKVEEDRFRVCIFGSARIQTDDSIYKMVSRIAALLGALGIDIVTGGGPGLMDAANKGAKAAQDEALSIGLTIHLPEKREPANPHLDVKSEHWRFSSRLDEFMRLSKAVIVAPGGIGTLLELMFAWQLIQVGMLEPMPIVLVDSKFWSGLLDWMHKQIKGKKLISAHDMDCIHPVDTEAEVLACIMPALEKFEAKQQAEGHIDIAADLAMIKNAAEQKRLTLERSECLPGALKKNNG